jgi:type II secretory pathway component PulM
MLDVMGLVGLSNSVLRSVDKRHMGDKIVVWAGCIVTLVVVYLLIVWKRGA